MSKIFHIDHFELSMDDDENQNSKQYEPEGFHYIKYVFCIVYIIHKAENNISKNNAMDYIRQIIQNFLK